MEKADTLKRLNKIEGQVRGIGRMVEEERYCIDILHQIQAVKAALSKVENVVLKNHSQTCVSAALASGNEEEQRRKFSELIELIGKFKK